MNPETNIPETVVQSPQKAHHMAIREDQMRAEVALFEREAGIYNGRFEKTGDPLYRQASLGKRARADAYQASINDSVDEVGEQYQAMSTLVQEVIHHTNYFVGEHARKHRLKMQERLLVVLGRYGMIGSKTQISQHTVYDLVHDRNMIVAGIHGEEVRNGVPGITRKVPYDPLKSTRK